MNTLRVNGYLLYDLSHFVQSERVPQYSIVFCRISKFFDATFAIEFRLLSKNVYPVFQFNAFFLLLHIMQMFTSNILVEMLPLYLSILFAMFQLFHYNFVLQNNPYRLLTAFICVFCRQLKKSKQWSRAILYVNDNFITTIIAEICVARQRVLVHTNTMNIKRKKNTYFTNATIFCVLSTFTIRIRSFVGKSFDS